MFEFEAGFTIAPISELPHEVLSRFAETGRLVAYRSMIRWTEHCSECAMPACYTTCEFYNPRPDMKCRRFRDGFVALHADNAAVDSIMRVTFRKWAKLEGSGSTRLLTKACAVRSERRDTGFSHMLHAAPLPFAVRMHAIRMVKSLGNRTRQRILADRANGSTSLTPNRFVIEAYNPGEAVLPLRLIMRPAEAGNILTFQERLALEPGYNRTLIPVADIAAGFDLASDFLVQIMPVDDSLETTVYFGLIDFVFIPEADLPRAVAPAIATLARTGDAMAKASGRKAKCVVWDLDDTLWRGTLIEDGLSGLTLNVAAVTAIHELDSRGILNSVASKNNAEDAFAALRHFGLLDYFLHPQVSWGTKSRAVAEIARKLNIGIDTVVFVDDQPFERAEVATAHPDVTVIDALMIGDFLAEPRFDVPITAESRARRKMYLAELQRDVAFARTAEDYADFLRSCEMRLIVSPLTAETVPRVHELAQRTNQMNFSGSRYSRTEIEEMLRHDNIAAYVLQASDRFGEYGIIGFTMVERSGPLMRDLMFSCRIQGKHIDRAALCWLLQTYAAAGGERFIALYNETDRNRLAAQVLWDIGFETSDIVDGRNLLVYDAAAKGIPTEDLVSVVFG